jgi:hypothetical protein
LEVEGVQRGKKEKKCFVSWKGYFSSCYFFITPFSFALHTWFLEVEVVFHNILNHSKWSTYDEEDINVFNHRQRIDDGPIYFRPMKVILQVNPFYHKCKIIIKTIMLANHFLQPDVDFMWQFVWFLNLLCKLTSYIQLAIQICQQEISNRPWSQGSWPSIFNATTTRFFL